MEEKIVCPKCNELKLLSDFGRRGKYRVSACKKCMHKNTQSWSKKNPERAKEYSKRYGIKKKYGMSWEQYQDYIKNGCAVCGSFESLCIDHDHSCCPGETTCGKCIRGVLCHRHNKALGWARDSIEELEGLISYLKSTPEHGTIRV